MSLWLRNTSSDPHGRIDLDAVGQVARWAPRLALLGVLALVVAVVLVAAGFGGGIVWAAGTFGLAAVAISVGLMVALRKL